MLRAGDLSPPAVGPSITTIDSTAPWGFQELPWTQGVCSPCAVGHGTSQRVHPVMCWEGQGWLGEQLLRARREDNVTFPPINEDFGL